MSPNTPEGRPPGWTGDAARDLSRLINAEVSVESLTEMELAISRRFGDEPALRLLAYQVNVIGQRLIALEK